MKRRGHKKQKRQQGRFFYNPFFVPLLIFLVFISLFVFFKLKDKSSLCANSISCVKNLSGEFESGVTQGNFLGRTISLSTMIAQTLLPAKFVLGDNTLRKHIEVNLNNQHLYAFEGNRVVYDFLVSTGKWAPTPTGVFNIWVKLRYTRMEGGSGSDYYNLPNVPFVMFFYNNEVPKSRGFSLHGAYWHNNFGHPMSHGCVNMRPEDAAILYAWANPPTSGNLTYANSKDDGTEVVIYGTAPIE